MLPKESFPVLPIFGDLYKGKAVVRIQVLDGEYWVLALTAVFIKFFWFILKSSKEKYMAGCKKLVSCWAHNPVRKARRFESSSRN